MGILPSVYLEPFMDKTGLATGDLSETSVDISWDKTECPPFDYTVDYTLVNLEGCDTTTVQTNFGSIEKDAEASVTLSNLASSSEYEVIVSSMNKEGNPRQLRRNFVTLGAGERRETNDGFDELCIVQGVPKRTTP